MQAGFAGQVVVITGGGTGIGRVTALAYARAGATVVVSARRHAPLDDTATAIAAADDACTTLPADVTAALSLYLASDAASAITGQTIRVPGGVP
jgi:NAD(P)-dependent dehydrogenase (short-subunit alcohol dehydrogenase family)